MPKPGGESANTLGKVPAAFLIGNAVIGAGILNFPEAFEFAGGIIMAMIIQIILLYLVIVGLVTICKIGIELEAESMQDMLLKTSGKGWEIFASITIILYSFFCCVAYHVVIGDQFDRILYSAYGSDFCHHWYMNRKFTIIVSGVFIILPFLFPKKIDCLKYISLVGVSAILYVVFLVFIEFFIGGYEAGDIDWYPKSEKILYTIPPICFAYHAHIHTVPIVRCMKDQSTKSLYLVCFLAMLGCMILYSIVGIFGYLTFGNGVKPNVLSNYNADNALVIIAIVVVAIKICCVYPVVVFCGRDSVIQMYLEIRKKDNSEGELLRRVVTALIWFFLAVSIALLFPNISIVIDILGFFVAFFVFLFAGVSLLNKTKVEKGPRCSFVTAVNLIVDGVVIAVLTLAISIYRIVSAEEHKVLCQ